MAVDFFSFANIACAIYDKQSAMIIIFISSYVLCLSHPLPTFMIPQFPVFYQMIIMYLSMIHSVFIPEVMSTQCSSPVDEF